MRLSLLICVALAWLTDVRAAEPKPITVTVGHEFKLTLQYNASTGYQWVLAKPPEEKLVKLLGTEYQRLDPKRVGAGGDMVLTFQALAEGRTEMGLNYVRPWEKGDKPAQTTNFVIVIEAGQAKGKQPYPIVGTGQTRCYDDTKEIPCPQPGKPFYGQDAQYEGLLPSYKDNGDGTVTDLNTGLIWVQARGAKVTWEAAVAGAAACRVGGHSDWRMPSIKALYSLITFTGSFRGSAAASTPYLNTNYFGFVYGDESKGERAIDSQDWSATQYVGTTMNGDATVFGVNFADGRIKGYPKMRPGPGGGVAHKLYVRYVRGNPSYGQNDFHDNGDGTITDRATGLMWARADGKVGMDWAAALAWVQTRNAEKHLGYNDWRLPNAKELQSIVDYTRAPAVTRSPALSPLFQTTALSDGEYAFFWSSTTHLDGPPDRQGSAAVYVAFGRALGWMQFPPQSGNYRLLDVHGAGAQRSDPKSGNPAAYPHGRGPQGDVIRINNHVRLVRTAVR